MIVVYIEQYQLAHSGLEKLLYDRVKEPLLFLMVLAILYFIVR
jgi:hypothetical protein